MKLTGLFFHIFGEDQEIIFQGMVQDVVNEDHVLVQYFDGFIGELSTIEVVPVAHMAKSAHTTNCGEGSWQFYETVDEMTTWYKRHKPKKVD